MKHFNNHKARLGIEQLIITAIIGISAFIFCSLLSSCTKAGNPEAIYTDSVYLREFESQDKFVDGSILNGACAVGSSLYFKDTITTYTGTYQVQNAFKILHHGNYSGSDWVQFYLMAKAYKYGPNGKPVDSAIRLITAAARDLAQYPLHKK